MRRRRRRVRTALPIYPSDRVRFRSAAEIVIDVFYHATGENLYKRIRDILRNSARQGGNGKFRYGSQTVSDGWVRNAESGRAQV